MEKTFTLFAIISFIFISSCSKKFYYLDAYQTPHSEETRNDSIFVQSSFAGDALDYIVFEISVKNKTKDTIDFSRTDVNLIMFENELNDRTQILPALDKEDILYELHHERNRVKQDKKTNTTLGILGVGLDLIGIVATGNASAAEAIIYTAESAGYILQDRRAFDLIEGSLEEKEQYIEQWVLGSDFIAPGESRSWDILFERILVKTDASLEVFCADYDFHFDYQFVIKEEKY